MYCFIFNKNDKQNLLIKLTFNLGLFHTKQRRALARNSEYKIIIDSLGLKHKIEENVNS